MDGRSRIASASPTVRYTDVDTSKRDGVTYTPESLAQFVAAEMVQLTNGWGRNRPLRVLDPAVGEGALAIALLDALHEQGFSNVEFTGVDKDERVLEETQNQLQTRGLDFRINCECADFLDQISSKVSENTPRDMAERKFDLVIANPPYVRTQVLGGEAAQTLAKRFQLSGRVDLYHAFILAIADGLAEDGVAGLIVSNRFMSTKSGAAVRERLPTLLNLESVWDLGDSKVFDAAVLPAVIVGRSAGFASTSAGPTDVRFVSMYEVSSGDHHEVADDPIAALRCSGIVKVADGRCFEVQHGRLDAGVRPGDVWRLSTPEIRSWLASVEAATAQTFGDLGKIRVGVKTTADKVFIRDDWSNCTGGEPELLRPLITHHIAGRYGASSPQKQILYPHESKGGKCKPVDLSLYPKSSEYLEEHRAVLEGRKYVRKAGRQWYEIWVPQDPAAWARTKLVFRDIVDRPTFWIDESGAVVNGDCYWLAPHESTEAEWLWLALAVANSTFAETFYDRRFQNKLYAGRRRYITQYVKHFPLPRLEMPEAQEAIAIAKQLSSENMSGDDRTENEDHLDRIVWSMFGVSREEVTR